MERGGRVSLSIDKYPALSNNANFKLLSKFHPLFILYHIRLNSPNREIDLLSIP